MEIWAQDLAPVMNNAIASLCLSGSDQMLAKEGFKSSLVTTASVVG